MKFLIILTISIFGFSSFAGSNCNQEAISAVSSISGIAKNRLRVLGVLQDDLVFYTFVADPVDESLVYEVQSDADSQCATTGYYEHSIYSDEFRHNPEMMAELSIFYKK